MVPHNKPTLGYREISAVKRVINSGWVAQGIEVNSLEDEIAAFLGLESSSNVVVVSSGTAALFLALWALESKGRRVGVPVYSCSALKNAIEMSGAVPVYLDCAKRSPNIDAPQLPTFRLTRSCRKILSFGDNHRGEHQPGRTDLLAALVPEQTSTVLQIL